MIAAVSGVRSGAATARGAVGPGRPHISLGRQLSGARSRGADMARAGTNVTRIIEREPPRDPRRLHSVQRGWSTWQDRGCTPANYVRGPSA